jgi:hypothetical protein
MWIPGHQGPNEKGEIKKRIYKQANQDEPSNDQFIITKEYKTSGLIEDVEIIC